MQVAPPVPSAPTPIAQAGAPPAAASREKAGYTRGPLVDLWRLAEGLLALAALALAATTLIVRIKLRRRRNR
jgi:hypothetical protein